MTCPDPEECAELVDLAGRIMLTHRLDAGHAMRLLGIDRREAEDMIYAGRLWSPLGTVRHERLCLFVNILTRLEHRFNHDSWEIRHMLEMSTDVLGGSTPADLFAGSLDDLRRFRRGIESIETPKRERWWRVGH